MNRRDFIGYGVSLGATAVSASWRAGAADVRDTGCRWGGWKEGHFQIHGIYTGVGESMYLIFPDGTSALIDCGDWPAARRGNLAVPVLPDPKTHAGEWVGRYIDRVNPRKGEVDYMIVSHFHSDHTGIASWAEPKPGGFPENGGCARSGFALVAEHVKFRRAIDRGWPDYNQPLTIDQDGAPELEHMRKIYAWLQKRDGLHVERFRIGAKDQIRQLYDEKRFPDFRVTNICGNGLVFRRDGTVDDTLYRRYLRGKRKWENAMSLGHVFRYGRFSFFTAGDFSDHLWAGHGKPIYYIEDALADAVGPVQVAKVNHHGYKSMPTRLVSALRARVWLACVWDQLHVSTPCIERLSDRMLYPGDRFIVPGYYSAVRRAAAKGASWLRDIPEETAEGVHIVVDVPPGGESYTVNLIRAADEKMTVRKVMRFKS